MVISKAQNANQISNERNETAGLSLAMVAVKVDQMKTMDYPFSKPPLRIFSAAAISCTTPSQATLLSFEKNQRGVVSTASQYAGPCKFVIIVSENPVSDSADEMLHRLDATFAKIRRHENAKITVRLACTANNVAIALQ